MRWRLVIPVKDQARAKSRLQAPTDVSRAELAHAFALDTLAAVFACRSVSHVLVVTADPRVADRATDHGALVEPDPGHGLNDALSTGMARAGAAWGDGPTALLLGDLPALDPRELTLGLAACAAHLRAVVPDRAGTGTVLLTSTRLHGLVPRFGPGSAAAHARTARRLDLSLPRLRTDVDDSDDLGHAMVLGLGACSRAVLAAPLA